MEVFAYAFFDDIQRGLRQIRVVDCGVAPDGSEVEKRRCLNAAAVLQPRRSQAVACAKLLKCVG
jgi:hypothetical protein